jgi:hypothetical protein
LDGLRECLVDAGIPQLHQVWLDGDVHGARGRCDGPAQGIAAQRAHLDA